MLRRFVAPEQCILDQADNKRPARMSRGGTALRRVVLTMTHTRQMDDDEGAFGKWRTDGTHCPRIIPASGLRCGHPVECRTWESHDGAYEDVQYRCIGGGHIWWVEGPDA